MQLFSNWTRRIAVEKIQGELHLILECNIFRLIQGKLHLILECNIFKLAIVTSKIYDFAFYCIFYLKPKTVPQYDTYGIHRYEVLFWKFDAQFETLLTCWLLLYST